MSFVELAHEHVRRQSESRRWLLGREQDLAICTPFRRSSGAVAIQDAIVCPGAKPSGKRAGRAGGLRRRAEPAGGAGGDRLIRSRALATTATERHVRVDDKQPFSSLKFEISL